MSCLFSRFTAFFVTFQWIVNIVIAYDVLLDRNFGMKTYCLSGLESIVFDGEFIPRANELNCVGLCYEDSFYSNDTMSFLPMPGYDLYFSFNLSNYSQPYSYIEFEATYISLGMEEVAVRALNDNAPDHRMTQLFVSGVYDDNSPVICSMSSTDLSRISSFTLASDISGDTIDFNVSSMIGYSSNLRSVLVTRNCVANCLTCATETSCSVCQTGFKRYKMASGNYFCEMTGSCWWDPYCQRYTSDGEDNICRSCYPGYSLDSTLTCQPNTASDSLVCESNEYVESNKCIPYSSVGYVQDKFGSGSYVKIEQLTPEQIQMTFMCPQNKLVVLSRANEFSQYSCRCFVSFCSKCTANDTCDLCNTGYTYNSNTKSCTKSSYSKNSFRTTQVVTDTGYELRAVFSKALLYETLASTNFEIIISNYSDFSYSLVGFEDDLTILFEIEMHSYAKNKDITLHFNNTDFVNANLLSSSYYTTTLQAFIYISDSDREAAATAESAATIASTVIISSLLPIAILSQFSAVVSTIDLTGFLYYLLYIDARFPINITSFYAVFKNFQLDFIPNPFTDMVSTGYMQISKVRFMQSDTDCYFLTSTGQSVTIFILIVMMYLFAKIMAKLNFPYISAYFKKSIYETWEYGGYFDAVWTIYIYLMIGVLMQFQSFDCSDQSCTWNYGIFFVSFLVSFVLPLYITNLIHLNPNLKEDEFMKTKISSLVAGVRLYSAREQQSQQATESAKEMEAASESREDDQLKDAQLWRKKYAKKLTKHYMPVLYVRKILFGLIIVSLNTFGYVQLVLITLLNIGMTFYFLMLRPLDSKHENYKGAISEIVMVIYQILVGILINDPDSQEESDRINIGWAAIAIISLVILWHTVGIILDFLKAIWQGLKAMFQKNQSSSKVSPINSNDIDKSNNNAENANKTHQKVNNEEADQFDESSVQLQRKLPLNVQTSFSNQKQLLTKQQSQMETDNGSPLKFKQQQKRFTNISLLQSQDAYGSSSKNNLPEESSQILGNHAPSANVSMNDLQNQGLLLNSASHRNH